MATKYGRFALTVLSLGLFNGLVAQVAAQNSPQNPGSVNLREVLSWLPADTETISIARGPFSLKPKIGQSKQDEAGNENRAVTGQQLAETFEALTLSLFGLKDGLLLRSLKDKQISLAVEGARHFRPPSGLGEMPYEGCAIGEFVDDLDTDMASFANRNRKSIVRVEQVEGQAVAVFREKSENDVWTSFVAFPNKRTIIVATNRDYLSQVLAGLQGKKGYRGLPSDRPEWNYVNTDIQFWGVRHYDRTQAKFDPSSPFGGQKSANEPDEKAIGLVYGFDPSNGGNTAKITYLSGDTTLGSHPDATLLSMGMGPDAEDLHIEYREVSPGVLEGSYTLRNTRQSSFFFFVFLGMLGHAVFI